MTTKPAFNHSQAIDALRWWAEAGVDWLIEETPQDRFAPTPPAPSASASSPPGPSASAPRAPPRQPLDIPRPQAAALLNAAPSDIVRAAAALAARAASLEALREAMLAFEGCSLKTSATQLVFGAGSAGAKLMFAGDVPSADDDRSGQPFSGTLGELLDAMLRAIGWQRADVFLTQLSPWRPPGNRELTPQEAAIGAAFLRRQIELAAPKVLVCFGGAPVQALLDVKDSLLRLRGRWFDYAGADGRAIKLLPLLHPKDLLRRPAEKRAAWADLRKLAATLSEP